MRDRTRLQITLWICRVASFIALVGTLAALWTWNSPGAALVALFAGIVFLIFPVIGTVLSVYFFWTGRLLTHCPFCMIPHVHRVTVEESQCDWCGHRETHFSDPIDGFGWASHRDGQEFEYCSKGCLDADKNARSVQNA